MKTDSDFNTNSMIGTKETIEEITLQEVANFNRGRAIIKDGESSKKSLIQVPYICENQYLSIVKSFSYLK
jgi:S-DNA-T family DNA segregation ATPase FtsK/SpoIIIE